MSVAGLPFGVELMRGKFVSRAVQCAPNCRRDTGGPDLFAVTAI